MIDYHCHILPGIDDGPTSTDDSLAMAQLLHNAGFTEVYCTPHCIRGVYDNTPATVRRAVAELQETLDWYRIPLKLRPGMEYYLDEFFGDFLDDLQPLGETRLVLVEGAAQASFEQVANGVFQLASRGYTPLLAHPERLQVLAPVIEPGFLSRLLHRLLPRSVRPETANPSFSLRRMGCRFQGNLGSLVGYYGKEVRARAIHFLESARYDCFGSDAHAPESLGDYLELGLSAVRDANRAFEIGEALRSFPFVNHSSLQTEKAASQVPFFLFLHGCPKSGKTALLQAIESTVSHEGVLRTEAESIVLDIPFSALDLKAFKQKYLLIENLLVDNFQMLSNRPAMAKELCRLVRDRQQAGRLTIVASSLSIEEWAAGNNLVEELLAKRTDIWLG